MQNNSKLAAYIMRVELQPISLRRILFDEVCNLYKRWCCSLSTDFVRKMVYCKTAKEWKSYPFVCPELALEQRAKVVSIVHKLLKLGDFAAFQASRNASDNTSYDAHVPDDEEWPLSNLFTGQVLQKLKLVSSDQQWENALSDFCDAGKSLHRVHCKEIVLGIARMERELHNRLDDFGCKDLVFYEPFCLDVGVIFRFDVSNKTSKEVSAWFRDDKHFTYLRDQPEYCDQVHCFQFVPCMFHK
jgi:hypothetical protein